MYLIYLTMNTFIWQGTNAVISYSILEVFGHRTVDGTRVSISGQPFTISPSAGVLSINSNLEREAAANGYYYYEIIVSNKCGKYL